MTTAQVEDIRKLVATLRGSDEADIKVRKDAQDIWFEADWLAELLEAFIADVDDETQKQAEQKRTVDALAAIILDIASRQVYKK